MDALDVRFYSHLKRALSRQEFLRIWNRKLLNRGF